MVVAVASYLLSAGRFWALVQSRFLIQDWWTSHWRAWLGFRMNTWVMSLCATRLRNMSGSAPITTTHVVDCWQRSLIETSSLFDSLFFMFVCCWPTSWISHSSSNHHKAEKEWSLLWATGETMSTTFMPVPPWELLQAFSEPTWQAQPILESVLGNG